MNIISNSCVGSRLYELVGVEFNNPFMWNVMEYKDFRMLIIDYENINFGNYKTSLYKTQTGSISKTIFDNKVNTYYIHYHQDESYTEPTKVLIDVYSNDIISYTNEKVNKRTERLIKNNEEPIFIYETRDRPRFCAIYDDETIDDYINLKTPYKKILITSNKKYKDKTGIINGCYILYFNEERPDLPPDTVKMAKNVYTKFKYLFE